MATPKWLGPFIQTMQADTYNVISSFDSALSAITGSGPIVGPMVYGNPFADMAQFLVEREKVLGEIDRQLFLQFLEGEVTYLKLHRHMKALAIFHKVEHDRQVCQRKQVQIRNALNRMMGTEGIDKGLYSALTAERGQTFLTYIKMKLSDDTDWTPTIDEYLEARETSAVRKIMEQLLVTHASDDSDIFDAHAAWIDLKDRWAAWASKHHERIASLKQYWTASGGGKSVNSNPGGIQVIRDYYKALFDIIEEGDLKRMIRQMGTFQGQ